MKNKKGYLLHFIGILSVAFVNAFPAYSLETNYQCTRQEEWEWNKDSGIEKSDFKNFEETLDQDRSLKETLSESAAFLAKKPGDEFSKKMYEYWVARGLMIEGYPHLSLQYFQRIFNSPVKPQTLSLYGAALSCIQIITSQYPTLTISIPLKNASLLNSNEKLKDRMKERAAYQLRDRLTSGLSLMSLQNSEEYKILSDSDYYKSWILGLFAAQQNKTNDVIRNLEKFFHEFKKTPKKSELIFRNIDSTRLLLARAYYDQKNLIQSQKVYADIQNASNHLPEKLLELAWSHLRTNHYSQAIGIASQLHESSLKVSFTPESWAILSISLNELCQFPLAMNTVREFYAQYGEESQWLKKFNIKNSSSLYEATARFIGQQQNIQKIPVRILTEWTRSSSFVNAQSEIHMLFKEIKNIQELMQSPDLKNEKTFFTTGLSRLKQRQSELAQNIESSLRSRTLQMRQELNQVSETLQLVQVEINTGASHDMIFLNAHNEFNEKVRNGKFEQKTIGPSKAPVWNWGNSKRKSGSSEIWEDEIGALHSRLGNLCNAKEEFMGEKESLSKK